MASVNVRSMSNDVLRTIAHWLNPKDRLNFAVCNKRIYDEIWGDTVTEELTNRFPVEHRLDFDLKTGFEAERCPTTLTFEGHETENSFAKRLKSLRIVPERSRSQHCHISVSQDGNLVAVLPYDNIVRLVDMRAKRVLSETIVGHICGMDIWDTNGGKHVVSDDSGLPWNGYEEEHRIDAEIGFGFSLDAQKIFLSGRSCLRIYCVSGEDKNLVEQHVFKVSDVLTKIDHERGVGGSCAISPDGKAVAWIIFAGSPAHVFVTLWDLETGLCTATCDIASVHMQRRSSIGWARVQYAPNGRYVLGIVNNARNTVQMMQSLDGFQQRKMNEFVLVAFDLFGQRSSDCPSTSRNDSVTEFRPARIQKTWLDISQEEFAKELATAISALVDGLGLHDDEPECRDWSTSAKKYLRRLPGIYLNSIHSCPSEATYKALNLGPTSKHPWLVIKQPMYSIHMSMNCDRAQIATASHANSVASVTRNEFSSDVRRRITVLRNEVHEESSAIVGGNIPSSSFASSTCSEALQDEISQSCPDIMRRRHAFYGMPWRAGYATATAFAATGKWLASVTLVDDKSVICVRNLTLQEFFG